MTHPGFVVCVIISGALKEYKVKYLESYNDAHTSWTFTPHPNRAMIIWNKEAATKLVHFLNNCKYWECAEVYTRNILAESWRHRAQFNSFIKDPEADLIELTYKL